MKKLTIDANKIQFAGAVSSEAPGTKAQKTPDKPIRKPIQSKPDISNPRKTGRIGLMLDDDQLDQIINTKLPMASETLTPATLKKLFDGE